MFRRRSQQPSRRAVLHVHADGDPAVPSDLASWFTERAFHFYLAGLRPLGRQPGLSGRAGSSRRSGPLARRGHDLGPTFADLDAACAHLRQADGMEHVIVTAQGRGAIAAALWSDHRESHRQENAGQQATTADALILFAPAAAGRSGLRLNIACPVLVLSDAASALGAPWLLRRSQRQRKPAAANMNLGSHVTWLQLSDSGSQSDLAEGADRRAFFDELGRWLGAYMYGQLRDQLL
jgi:hypothetical protein